MKRLIGIMVAIAAVLAISVCVVGCAGETGSADNAITVSATATAKVEPDRATISFTAHSEGETAEAAQAKSAETVASVIARLKTLGVDEQAVTSVAPVLTEKYGTEGYEVVPYGYEDEYGNWVEESTEVYYDRTGEIVGYDAAIRMTLTDFEASKFGPIMRELVSAGATTFGDLTFSVSDRDAAYHQALENAVDAAHTKAESLASASGVYVGRVVNMVENSSVPTPDQAKVAVDAATLDIEHSAALDIIPTPVTVEASVTVSYAIS